MRQIFGKMLRPTTPANGALLIPLLLAAISILLALSACSTESRHRIIVYDQPWSSEAGVKNLWCAAEQSADCKRQAREAEIDFSKRLSRAFHEAPECKTVQFIILAGDQKNSNELEDRLDKNAGSEYWRLRVDFGPGLTKQLFTLGLGKGKASVGGDDAEHSAAFICEAAKNNGITAIW